MTTPMTTPTERFRGARDFLLEHREDCVTAYEGFSRPRPMGRADDVFKAGDYKISPFEPESALLEHEAVAEVAVVPAPDELRLALPKASVVPAQGWEPGPDTAKVLFEHSRTALAPYKRVRRLEFADLPKTVSGKIRRIELGEATAAGSTEGNREEEVR